MCHKLVASSVINEHLLCRFLQGKIFHQEQNAGTYMGQAVFEGPIQSLKSVNYTFISGFGPCKHESDRIMGNEKEILDNT